jgi:anti-sigma B factor antagonist
MAMRSPEHGALRMRSFSDGDTHVIALAGELDLATVGAVERELRRAETTSALVVAIDLRRLTFIDVIGVRLVVEAQRRASDGSHRLILVRGGATIQRVFEICGLADALRFVDALPSDEVAGRPAVTATSRRPGMSAADASRPRRPQTSRRITAAARAAVRELRAR